MKPPAVSLDEQLAAAKTQRERKAKRAAAEELAAVHIEPKPKRVRPWDYTGRYKQGGAR